VTQAQEEQEVFDFHLDAIAREAGRMADAARLGLKPQVPGCPDWSVADLVAHVADVYEFWTAQVEAATDERVAPKGGDEPDGAGGDGSDDEHLTRLEMAASALLASLSSSPPEQHCWNWAGSDGTAAWVARRMALESAIHRIDAEQAHHVVTPIETTLAVDGIDERIAVHLAVDVPEEPSASLGGSLCLVCDDTNHAWVVEVAGGRLTWRNGRGPADAVLVGDASSVFQFTWNRLPLDALTLTGRREVAGAWAGLPV
jgi:uncharacterized protein (TIGR03083 family)